MVLCKHVAFTEFLFKYKRMFGLVAAWSVLHSNNSSCTVSRQVKNENKLLPSANECLISNFAPKPVRLIGDFLKKAHDFIVVVVVLFLPKLPQGNWKKWTQMSIEALCKIWNVNGDRDGSSWPNETRRMTRMKCNPCGEFDEKKESLKRLKCHSKR